MPYHTMTGVRPATLLTMMSALPRGEVVDTLARYAMTNWLDDSLQGSPLITHVSADTVAQLAHLRPALPYWAPEFLVGLQQEDALAEVHAQWPDWHWAQAALYLNPVAHQAGLAPSVTTMTDLASQPSSELRHALLMLPTAVAQYAALGVPTPPLRKLAAAFTGRPTCPDKLVGRLLTKAWAWPYRPTGVEHVVEPWVAEAWQQATAEVAHLGHTTKEHLERDVRTATATEARSWGNSYGGAAYENPWMEEELFRPGCTHWEVFIGHSMRYTGGVKHAAGRVLGRRLVDALGDDSGAWLTAINLLEHWDQPLDQWLVLQEALR